MQFAKGKFKEITATLTLGLQAEETATLDVKEGDTLTNVKVAAGNYGSTEERVIESCTVVGFTMKPIDVARGNTRTYDGVPMYMADPNGGQYRGFVQEVVEVRDIIVSVAPVDGEESEEEPETLRIAAGNIISVGEEPNNGDNGDEEPDNGDQYGEPKEPSEPVVDPIDIDAEAAYSDAHAIAVDPLRP